MGCGTKCQITSVLAGITLVAFGYFLYNNWDQLLREQLRKKFILSPTSRTFDSFVKTKVPVYSRFYFFNWTNPSDMSADEYKPTFDEVGPYTFRESLEKVDIVWNDNGTVSYRLKRFWYFERELSVGPLTDRITSVNPVAAAVKYSTRHSFSMSTLTRIAAPEGFHTKSVKSVEELLFLGYEDTLINLGRFSQIFFADMREIPYDRFGWWYPRNGSVSEVYNIETGSNGMDTFGEVRSWNYKSNPGFFNGSCGDASGSGGNFWPWDLQESDDVVLFSADICRSIAMSFVERVSYDGLPAYKYESGANFVDNGTLYTGNECLCNGECVPSGVFNASRCSKDAPVFISYPHFHHADPYYPSSVGGMKPDRKRHVIYLILEPKYGVPLELSAPLQINLLVETNVKSRGWSEGAKKRIFFPVLWVDQSFKIEAEDLGTMKLLSQLPLVGFAASVCVMVAGVALSCLSVACRLTTRRNRMSHPMSGAEKSERTVAPAEKGTVSNGKHKFNYVKDSHL